MNDQIYSFTPKNYIYVLQTFRFLIFRINLTTMDQLNAVTKTIDNTMQKIVLANLTLGNLKTKTVTLKESALNLKQNSTKLQERNVEGMEIQFISMIILLM